MRVKDDGGPAFPTSRPGMSLRDYFAAKAIDIAAAAECHSPTGQRGEQTYRGIALRCYALADAMLEARKS